MCDICDIAIVKTRDFFNQLRKEHPGTTVEGKPTTELNHVMTAVAVVGREIAEEESEQAITLEAQLRGMTVPEFKNWIQEQLQARAAGRKLPGGLKTITINDAELKH